MSFEFAAPLSDPDFDPTTVPVRPAATVMLVRDSDDTGDLEVFMLRRTAQAAFGGGMYVFPGGRLDAVDSSAEMESVCDGLDDTRASSLLGVERDGLAFWVAAIRECFEEAGVLLARSSSTGDVLRFDDPEVAARFAAERGRIYDSSTNLVNLCAAEGLRLATDTIHYTAHWITPVGERRRFDTRFFVARAPHAQEPLHDDGETVASLWVRPGDALTRQAAGDLLMMPPTMSSLRFLADFASADAACTAAATLGPPPPIQPRLVTTADGRIRVLMPGDDGYDA
ncbi:MAG TPA: NUDIX domain-containing protein [Ilumatobacteraceae bacterium]|nr:NUDIX domain-containing protein [Ilumatobacteraceae bacterium]